MGFLIASSEVKQTAGASGAFCPSADQVARISLHIPSSSMATERAFEEGSESSMLLDALDGPPAGVLCQLPLVL